MKNEARIGAVIDLSVRRRSGAVDHIGRLHNIVGNTLASNSQRTEFSGSPSVTFYTHPSAVKSTLGGTWSQTGTTVSRVSGSATLPSGQGDLLVFGTGEQAYKTAGSGSSCTVSRSRSVAETTLDVFATSTLDVSTGFSQSKTGASAARSYAAGVLAWTLTAPQAFDPASSGYTANRVIALMSLGGSNFMHFDLPAPVTLGVGDQFIVNSFVLRFTYDAYAPREFVTSPIGGISGSGRFQRLRTVSTRENSTPTRIYLIADANKITVPDMLAPEASVINPASITMLETITGTGSLTNPNTANNMTQSNSIFGTVATGGTVKQIAWGTTTELFGIVEYDTPVSIAASKVLTIGGALQLEAEVP